MLHGIMDQIMIIYLIIRKEKQKKQIKINKNK